MLGSTHGLALEVLDMIYSWDLYNSYIYILIDWDFPIDLNMYNSYSYIYPRYIYTLAYLLMEYALIDWDFPLLHRM